MSNGLSLSRHEGGLSKPGTTVSIRPDPSARVAISHIEDNQKVEAPIGHQVTTKVFKEYEVSSTSEVWWLLFTIMSVLSTIGVVASSWGTWWAMLLWGALGIGSTVLTARGFIEAGADDVAKAVQKELIYNSMDLGFYQTAPRDDNSYHSDASMAHLALKAYFMRKVKLSGFRRNLSLRLNRIENNTHRKEYRTISSNRKKITVTRSVVVPEHNIWLEKFTQALELG